MNATHTAGPWRVGERRREFIDIRHSDNSPGAISGTLAQVIARETWSAEGEANARLVAATPDLLDALETLLDCFVIDPLSWMNNQSEAIEKARDALFKATGV